MVNYLDQAILVCDSSLLRRGIHPHPVFDDISYIGEIFIGIQWFY
jgi:hypothetical protein